MIRTRVLVVFSQGWSVRNYFCSGFLQRLRRDMHVTVALRLRGEPLDGLLAPVSDQVVETPVVQKKLLARWSEAALSRAWWYRHPSQTVRYKRAAAWHAAWSSPSGLPKLALAEAGAMVLARGPLFGMTRAIEQRVNLSACREAAVDKLFAEIRPDIVFSTTPHVQAEHPLLRMARAQNVPIATAVASWDNPSSKGRFPILFDRYYVWSDAMAEEMRVYYPEVPAAKIKVTGTPQFDQHIRDRDTNVMPRAEFCKRMGLDPARPIVTYSTVPTGYFLGEDETAGQVAEAFRDKKVPGDPQLLVRVHPLDDGSRFRPLEQHGARVVRPWAFDARERTWSYPTPDDMALLWATLAHSAVNINFRSTMTLDFSLFGKPVINTAIVTKESRQCGIDVMSHYLHDHYKPIIDAKAVKLVTSLEDLLAAIGQYLKTPEQEADGRAEIVRRICGPLDGKASDRIANDLIGFRTWV